ncbi:MAG: FapA family protein [Lachnospiraceae bacterium]|nr:FapA family protein [Lachnospiraceae bacterium]
MGSRDDRSINRVIIKNNDMEAYLNLSPPPEGQSYDVEEILQFLATNGVKVGISTSRVSAMIRKEIYNHDQLVAEGTPPVAGEDGYFEFFFEATGNGKKHPLIRSDGTVDYTSVNVIECVEAGDKLAVYHPAVKEQPGMSVKGRAVPGKRAKELPPLRTTGCTYVEEELTYYADIEGRVEASKSRLSVTGVQEFKKDIDNVFGNVIFNGDVIIHGSVSEGVSIKATRSITIEGVFHGDAIEAGEDIVIKGGILGSNGTKIICKGDVLADFIEYTDVEADGDVSANYILDSNIVSKAVVHATGSKGSIVGGDVYGMRGVEARFLGNDVFLKTCITAGVKDDVIAIRKELARQEKELSVKFQQMKIRSDELERRVRLGTADEAMMAERQTLMREKIEKKAELQEMEQRTREFDELMRISEGAVIRAFDTAYEGAVIMIDNQQYVMTENKRGVEFSRDDAGNLMPKPIPRNLSF